MLLGGGVVEVGVVVLHVAKAAHVAHAERVGLEGVDLLHVATAVDAVGEDDHGAATGSVRVGGQGDGLVEVHGAVGRGGGGGAHGAGNDDGLVGLYGQVEEIGRLLKRVGAMGDGEAGDGVVGSKLVDGLGHLDPVGIGDVVGADIAYLHTAHVGDVSDAGGAGHKRADVKLASGVARGLASLAGSRDGAARGEYHDGGQVGVFVIGDGHLQSGLGLDDAVAVASGLSGGLFGLGLFGKGRACGCKCDASCCGACDECPASGFHGVLLGVGGAWVCGTR